MPKIAPPLIALPLVLALSGAQAACPESPINLPSTFTAGESVTLTIVAPANATTAQEQLTLTVLPGPQLYVSLDKYCNGQTIRIAGAANGAPSVENSLPDLRPPLISIDANYKVTVDGTTNLDGMPEFSMYGFEYVMWEDVPGASDTPNDHFPRTPTGINDDDNDFASHSFSLDRAQLAAGSTYRLAVFDASGNYSEAVTFTVPVELNTAKVDSAGTQVSGTASPQATITVTANGSPVGTTTSDANGNYTVTLSPAQAPNTQLTVTATIGTTDSAPLKTAVPAAPPPSAPAATPVPTMSAAGMLALSALMAGVAGLRRCKK